VTRRGARAAPGTPAATPTAAELADSPLRFDSSWLASKLRRLLGTLKGRRLCVAFSGGLDSGALLAALAELRGRERLRLRALHVNHRLHPQALRWARAARARARGLHVDCRVITISIARARGESPEAAARAQRYRALAAQLAPGELLLTAHHQEDQLETLLLALLRGSGVRGLAAMSALTPWAGTWLLRPLLPISRRQLEQYSQLHGLSWSEDPSNADTRFDRNFLRQQVIPLLKQRWPAAAATVGRSAALLAEARSLLEQQARVSLRDARDGMALRVSVLRRLSAGERHQALRQWLLERGLPLPDHARLREIAGPMLSARADARAQVRWRGGELRRCSDRLFAFNADAAAGAAVQAIEAWDWRLEPWLRLAGGGSLGLVRDRHGDVQLAALPARLGVRFRRGGERLPGERGHMALKDLLQLQGLAPWERAAVPLIVDAERIIAVADLWLDRAYRAQPGPQQVGEQLRKQVREPAGGEARDVDAGRGRFRWRRIDGTQD
jgi:tRNA(Ile)-lysidine synthase